MKPSASAPTSPALAVPATVPWRELFVFLGVTFGGVWIAGLLQWINVRDVRDPSAVPFIMAAMFTPTLGVLVAAAVTGLIRRPRALLATTGITPLRPLPRLLRYTVLGLLLPPMLTVLVLAIGAAAGEYHFHDPLPVGQLATALASGLLMFPLGLVLVFGEEWGWRGYLLPALLPLGLWPGLLISGAIWGLFHAPFALQGYQYPDHPDLLGVLAFTVASILIGAVLSWLRLASGSIWPAVVAHSAINFLTGGIPSALGRATDPDSATLTASLAGWPGWIVLAAVIASLAATGQFRRRHTASHDTETSGS